MRLLRVDRGELSPKVRLLGNGALLALLYLGLSANEITLFNALAGAGFDRSASSWLLAFSIAGSALGFPVVIGLERRSGTRHVNSTVMIALANAVAFQILAETLRRQPGLLTLGVVVIGTSALNSAAMALITSRVIRAVGPVDFGRLRAAGTLGFVMACVAVDIADPRRLASGVFLALAGCLFLLATPSHRGIAPIPDSNATRHAPGPGMGRVLLLALAALTTATARPYESAGYDYLSTAFERPGVILSLGVVLELWVLARWVPRQQTRPGGTGRMLTVVGAAWTAVYAGLWAASSSGNTWICLAVLPMQGFNVAALTSIQAALGAGARSQAAILIAASIGKLVGTATLGLSAPNAKDPSTHSTLWVLSATFALGACLVAAVASRAAGKDDGSNPEPVMAT